MASDTKILDRRTYGKGHTIFKEGQHGDEAYILEKGKVRIFKSISGRRIDIGQVEKNGIFGEFALMDGSKRMASAEVVEDATVIVLTKKSIDTLLDQAPKGLTVLIRSLLRTTRAMGDDLAETKAALPH